MPLPLTLQGRARTQTAKAQPFAFSIDDLGRAGAKAVDQWGRDSSRAVDKWMRAVTQPGPPPSAAPAAPRQYTRPPEKHVMTSRDHARVDARRRAAATPGYIRAFNNGASFNTADEIDAFGAALETGVNNFSRTLGLTQGAPYTMREAYDAVHAAEAEATRAYARRRPIVSGVATGAGAVANPLNKVGVGWIAKGGSLSNVALRSAALGGLNGAASGAGEGSSLEERLGNAGNGMIFGTAAGGVAPYLGRGLETAVKSAAKVVVPKVRALAEQIPAPVSQAYADMVRRGSDVFARGWPPKKSVVMNSGGDRLFGSMGSARVNNAAELDNIISDLRARGVDISLRDGQFAYGPAASGGRPGNIIFDPDGSISAVRHEYGHFLDDQALGFPGQRFYYENPGKRVATERSQYLGEIRTGRELGDHDARRALIQDYLDERNYLIDHFYTMPYGGR